MYDRTIPFFNTILRCDHYEVRPVILPDGYAIVPYHCGFEKDWALLEYALGDFDSAEQAEHYFVESYLQNPARTEDLLFLIDTSGKVIGSVLAWQDPRNDSVVSSLHWLVLDEQHQGQGLGKALCIAVLNRFAQTHRLPIYIHTQPWSWKAILLYESLGFHLQQSDSFSHYKNEYTLAMQELKKLLSQEAYTILEKTSQP